MKKSRFLASASALAIIVGTAACDKRSDVNDDNEVVQNLDHNANENKVDDDPRTR
jgi:hypothetical protein